MKKIITISALSLAFIALPAVILAQGGSQGLDVVPQRMQDSTVGKTVKEIVPKDNKLVKEVRQVGQQAGQQAGLEEVVDATDTAARGAKATQGLNRVAERNNNPEVGEQVRTMVQNYEKTQVRTKTALKTMDERSSALKFLIGPDYKNAGEVRSSVVGLRNDIQKLEKIKENTLSEDAEDIQSSISELKLEADKLETDLAEQTDGFSLFGWLSKMFAN